MAPRNSNNAQSNKTLTTQCAACEAEISSEVGNNPAERSTWGLVGIQNNAKAVFPVCTKCYNEGWRPPGHEGS